MPDLRLKVDGTLYGGWQTIRVARSIEQIAGTFTLGVTERWSGQKTVRPIRPGAACQLLIDAVPVITGYVDDVQLGYDDNSHSVTISGRDKTGDLVDCGAPYFQWKGTSLLTAAQRLCKPFGITVSDLAQANAPFSILMQNPGDSVFTSLDAFAKIRGVLLVSDGNGTLLITRASNDRIGAMLLLGENILSCSATFSHKDRFSEYTIATQQEVKDADLYGAQAIHITATSSDSAIARHRPLMVINDKILNLKQAQERANWERNVRFGKGQRIQYVVQGWQYDTNALWPINKIVAVKDDYLGLDADLLIVSTTFVLDDSGFRTEITLTPREAFDLVELPEIGDQWYGA